MRKNLSSILRGFSKTLSDLKTLSEQNCKEIEIAKVEIQVISERKLALIAENEKASRIIQNIEKLLDAA